MVQKEREKRNRLKKYFNIKKEKRNENKKMKEEKKITEK
jgi:hypothetical protein